jgi:lipoprotein-anchoring transpeptidase ErfK/SrfK
MPHFKSLRAAALMGATLLGVATPLAAANANTHLVSYHSSYDAGTIVISMSQRKLYLVLDDGRAIQYPVAVAKPGKEWLGSARIQGKYSHPDWTPPAVVKHDHPGLPNFIPGGSPRNPMGVAAMTLDRFARVLWLHSDAERRRRRSLRPRRRRHRRRDAALIPEKRF